MFKIGLDRADFDVLLDVLEGTHKRSRSEYVQQAVCGVLVAAGLALLGSAYALDETVQTGWYFWLGLPVLGVMAHGLLSLISDLPTTYCVDSSGVRKDSPLKFLAWYIHVSELHLVELDTSRGATLTLKTVDDRKRTMPLFRSAEDQLQTLYPQLLGPDTTPTFTPWVGKWVLVGALIIGLITVGILLCAAQI